MSDRGDVETPPREIDLRPRANRSPENVHSKFTKAWWALEEERAKLVGELPEKRKESDRLSKKAAKAMDESSSAAHAAHSAEEQIRAIEDQQNQMEGSRDHVPGI